MAKRKCSAKQLAALKKGREKLARKRATTNGRYKHRRTRTRTNFDWTAKVVNPIWKALNGFNPFKKS